MTTQEIETIRAECAESARGPGKFEGEPDWVPYFYGMACEGFSQSGGCGWDWFEIDDDDRAIFPDLADSKSITLLYREDGFVIGELDTPNPEDDSDGDE